MAKDKPRYNEKVDRNNEIYQDRLSGLSWSKLSFKYNLTIKTIHTIVKRLASMDQRNVDIKQSSSDEEVIS